MSKLTRLESQVGPIKDTIAALCSAITIGNPDPETMLRIAEHIVKTVAQLNEVKAAIDLLAQEED